MEKFWLDQMGLAPAVNRSSQPPTGKRQGQVSVKRLRGSEQRGGCSGLPRQTDERGHAGLLEGPKGMRQADACGCWIPCPRWRCHGQTQRAVQAMLVVSDAWAFVVGKDLLDMSIRCAHPLNAVGIDQR